MPIPEHELQITLSRLADGRRAIRIVHLPTGISVEDDGTSEKPIVGRRQELVAQIEQRVSRK